LALAFLALGPKVLALASALASRLEAQVLDRGLLARGLGLGLGHAIQGLGLLLCGLVNIVGVG